MSTLTIEGGKAIKALMDYLEHHQEDIGLSIDDFGDLLPVYMKVMDSPPDCMCASTEIEYSEDSK